MNRSVRAGLLALGLVVTLAACGDDGAGSHLADPAPVTDDAGGDPTAPAGETDRGLPFPAGGRLVVSEGQEDNDRLTELEYAAADYRDLVDFFDDHVADLPFQVSRGQVGTSITWQIFGDRGRQLVSIEANVEAQAGDGYVTYLALVG